VRSSRRDRSLAVGDEQLVELECEKLLQPLRMLAGVEHAEGQLPPVVERDLRDDVVEVSSQRVPVGSMP
jgi:hypothetical protein